ncbi:MAG TPA: ferritin-like domain-containing protein [bacterium]
MKMQMLDSLEGLFINELKDVYNAEHQVMKALPKLCNAAASPELKDAFLEHLDQTRMQIERLEEVFDMLNLATKGKKCEAMQGIIEEGQEIIDEDGDDAVKDAALIAAAQKVEHYEIATYGCLRTWAVLLGHEQVAEILEDILEEEKQTDLFLTEIAENIINEQAVDVEEETMMYNR